MLTMEFVGYDVWLYGGILLMGLAVIFFTVQTIFYFVRKTIINHILDEEYGQPQKYHVREKG